MSDPLPTHIIFIPDDGQLPDCFADVVNALPTELGLSFRIVPWSGGLAAAAAGVEKLMDKLELRRVVLVGGAMGAAIALRVAQAQPQRITHLIVDSPMISVDPAMAQRLTRAVRTIPGFLFRKNTKKNVQSTIADLGDLNVAELSVAIPTLVISGSEQCTTNARELAESLADVATKSIPGAGLRTYLSHPADCANAIAEFITAR